MATCPRDFAAVIVDIPAIATDWRAGGGSEAHIVAAVAVALAESYPAGNIYSKSPTCALGLWQIEYFHADTYGLDAEQLYNPVTNAKIAVALSADGTNWREWDTAYAAGESLTTRYDIAIPERGSIAWQHMPQVASVLGLPDPSGQAPGAGPGPVTPGQQGPIPGVGTPPAGGSSPGQPGQIIPATRPQFSPWGPIEPPLPRAAGWDNLRQWWGQDQQAVLLQYNAIYDWLRENLR